MNSGTEFNFSFAPGITEEQIVGFELAGEYWSQYLTDDVGINIHIEMTDSLPENVIGGAIPAISSDIKYADYRSKLAKDIDSDIDKLINRHQQDETDKFTAYFESQFGEDGYKVDNNEYMQMTRANAKALNLVDADSMNLDGYIVMRDLNGVGDGELNNLTWNYDYQSHAVGENELNFLSVAVHEVGHILGFISGIDESGWLAERANLKRGNEDDYYSNLVGNLNNATPLDMLRFSRASYESSGDGENWIDMSLGGNPYMSFKGSGGRPIAYFSTGKDNSLGGDGYQASHWKESGHAIGIMSPTLATGQKQEITKLDVQSLDAIGWDVNYGAWIDMQSLYNQAQAAVDSVLVVDRQDEIDEIFNSDAYERRRSRGSTTFRMTADGYFSTFSQPDAALSINQSNEVLARIDDWVVINNDAEQTEANNIVRVESDSLFSLTKSVDKVAADYLEIDSSNSESDLLKEIRESLDTGLEIEIATQTL